VANSGQTGKAVARQQSIIILIALRMNTIVKGSKPGPIAPSFSPNSSPFLEKPYARPSKGLSEGYDSSNRNLHNVLPERHEKSEVGTTVSSISHYVTNASDPGYPEGGLRAWLVVFGSFCGMVGSFGFMNTSVYYLFQR
jgi:hypothetical protein